ncbi:hypothetical protein HGM15179_001844 [Zosterops borbonicus]|uniref:Uncharacterized protein n=1 Tax=Zosterops borbonicus TaxID=364589 RepID=A0A8K1LSK4_9PASS|nr:hypothetical protein HGM15179_001844 [Zosterops borbonicus]
MSAPALGLPDWEPVIHDCLETIETTYSSHPDLKDTPIEDAETWFTDRSSYVVTGKWHAGYAVTTSREWEPVIHDCLETIETTYSSHPDLKDTPIEDAETWFTDRSSYVVTGKWHAGYAVTTSREIASHKYMVALNRQLREIEKYVAEAQNKNKNKNNKNNNNKSDNLEIKSFAERFLEPQ